MLSEKEADKDPEVIQLAEDITKAVETHASDVPRAIGIDLDGVKVGIARIKQIHAKAGATGFKARDSEFEELNIDEINAGGPSKN